MITPPVEQPFPLIQGFSIFLHLLGTQDHLRIVVTLPLCFLLFHFSKSDFDALQHQLRVEWVGEKSGCVWNGDTVAAMDFSLGARRTTTSYAVCHLFSTRTLCCFLSNVLLTTYPEKRRCERGQADCYVTWQIPATTL